MTGKASFGFTERFICFVVKIYKRFTNIQDKKWFDQIYEKNVISTLGSEYGSKIVQEPYFVNFLREDFEENEEDLLNDSTEKVENNKNNPAKTYEEVRIQ